MAIGINLGDDEMQDRTIHPEYSIKDELKHLFLTRVQEAKDTAVMIYGRPCADLAEIKQRLSIISLLVGSLTGQLEMLMHIQVEDIGVTVEDIQLIFTP